MAADTAAARPDTDDPAVAAAVTALGAAWREVQDLMVRVPVLVDEQFDIPPHRLHVLGAVDQGAARIQEIAERGLTSVSAASRTVDGLVRDGWLDRRPDPDDRRATQVTLTRTGRAHLDEVHRWAEAMMGRLVTALGVDRAERVAADVTAFARGVSDQLDSPGD
jgi:DNA-binding MarR family transcriptional regulator